MDAERLAAAGREPSRMRPEIAPRGRGGRGGRVGRGGRDPAQHKSLPIAHKPKVRDVDNESVWLIHGPVPATHLLEDRRMGMQIDGSFVTPLDAEFGIWMADDFPVVCRQVEPEAAGAYREKLKEMVVADFELGAPLTPRAPGAQEPAPAEPQVDSRILAIMCDESGERWRTVPEMAAAVSEVDFEDLPLRGAHSSKSILVRLRRE